MNNKTVVIDASSISYAAFHTTGHLSYNNMQTGIIYGFVRRLLSMAIKFETTDFIFCWDDHITHRHKDYPEYKQKRKKVKEKDMEEDPAYEQAIKSLRAQMILLKFQCLPTMGFMNNFLLELYEADDLLAHWAKKLAGGREVIMVTSDADMYQCLDYCRIWCPMKKKYFTKKMFVEKYGIQPDQWAMAKAIGGCDGDGVIGIAGVADPKKETSKALKYLQGKLPNGKIKSRIESDKGQAIIKRNLPIVTAPYQEELMGKMIKRRNRFSKKGFIKVFDSLHFKSLLANENFSKWEKTFLKEAEDGRS